jgi:hypothetical protein
VNHRGEDDTTTWDIPDRDRSPVLLVSERAGWTQVVGDVERSGARVRVVRGDRCETTGAMFDEFAAALQFPLYFGANWGAFDECLAEEDYARSASTGFVLVVSAPVRLLAHEAPDRLPLLVDSLREAAHAWNHPVEEGESWDRPAIAYHVVLLSEPEHSRRTRTLWAATSWPLP